MKVNYGNYASEQLQSERRKLHRKLILPNIFIRSFRSRRRFRCSSGSY